MNVYPVGMHIQDRLPSLIHDGGSVFVPRLLFSQLNVPPKCELAPPLLHIVTGLPICYSMIIWKGQERACCFCREPEGLARRSSTLLTILWVGARVLTMHHHVTT